MLSYLGYGVETRPDTLTRAFCLASSARASGRFRGALRSLRSAGGGGTRKRKVVGVAASRAPLIETGVFSASRFERLAGVAGTSRRGALDGTGLTPRRVTGDARSWLSASFLATKGLGGSPGVSKVNSNPSRGFSNCGDRSLCFFLGHAESGGVVLCRSLLSGSAVSFFGGEKGGWRLFATALVILRGRGEARGVGVPVGVPARGGVRNATFLVTIVMSAGCRRNVNAGKLWNNRK